MKFRFEIELEQLETTAIIDKILDYCIKHPEVLNSIFMEMLFGTQTVKVENKTDVK